MVLLQMLRDAESRFRQRAADLHRYQSPAGVAWDDAADALADVITEYWIAAVDLAEASRLSGVTGGHLRRLLGLARGYPLVIPNAGTRKEPGILVRHLPRLAGHGIDPSEFPRGPDDPRLVRVGTQAAPSSPAPEQGAVVEHDPPRLADAPRNASSWRLQVARAVATGS